MPPISSQRPSTSSGDAPGLVLSGRAASPLGFAPTPNAKEPELAWPSTAETPRQLTV